MTDFASEQVDVAGARDGVQMGEATARPAHWADNMSASRQRVLLKKLSRTATGIAFGVTLSGLGSVFRSFFYSQRAAFALLFGQGGYFLAQLFVCAFHFAFPPSPRQ